MPRHTPRSIDTAITALTAAALSLFACSKQDHSEPLLPPETFTWVAQSVTFSPPPQPWERQGDNGGGMLGVRFILRGGGGQCISVAAFRALAERDRREALRKLIAGRDSLTQRQFLQELSLARARTDDPISDREAAVASEINEELDGAMSDLLAGEETSAQYALEAALRAAKNYEPTLEELIPRIRLWPDRMQHPDRWKLGIERDTLLAGLPAFATDDTLYADEQVLLYQERFWVVSGFAFKATFQGRAENLETFHRVVDSIQFPEADDASSL